MEGRKRQLARKCRHFGKHYGGGHHEAHRSGMREEGCVQTPLYRGRRKERVITELTMVKKRLSTVENHNKKLLAKVDELTTDKTDLAKRHSSVESDNKLWYMGMKGSGRCSPHLTG
jgi:hypothetical protein